MALLGGKQRVVARPRPDYRRYVFERNLWLSAAQHLRKGASESKAYLTTHIGQLHLIERSANLFPLWLRDDGIGNDNYAARRPNPDFSVRRERRVLSVGEIPTRQQSFQPVAIGTVVEVTKRLKLPV